ncbi:hypothetical protein MOK15_17790 [Sphingobium sp. BYY-5]|uniref:hypothetical protein n=1 Tax=Sphingobium sp. BYY-5 TaxID=2926400 RepID=UPI001FA705FF|nr:hypothetical protein [Sphingobium sp. BYY-5]MCI4591940.1 hypothetical protein [Sphingobium sp. BYY-5]
MASLALASCGSPETAEKAGAKNEANASGVDYAAAVAALPPGQRNGVFFRAVRDAGLPCQKIVSAELLKTKVSNGEWKVQCDNGDAHLISIAHDGQAIVTSRSD